MYVCIVCMYKLHYYYLYKENLSYWMRYVRSDEIRCKRLITAHNTRLLFSWPGDLQCCCLLVKEGHSTVVVYTTDTLLYRLCSLIHTPVLLAATHIRTSISPCANVMRLTRLITYQAFTATLKCFPVFQTQIDVPIHVAFTMSLFNSFKYKQRSYTCYQ